MNRITYIVALAVLLFLPGRAFAQYPTASVDQVLGALAEVVKDHAKRVASRVIIIQIEKKLCDGELKLTNPDPENASQQITTLYLGGTPSCKTKQECNSDDLFPKSCRLLQRHSVKLTDPYFLKSLSRETIGFGLRVASYKMSKKQYEEAGMPQFANYIHDIMEAMAGQSPNILDIIGPTLRLADELSPVFAPDVLARISNWEETTKLLKKVKDHLDQSCIGIVNSPCQELKNNPAVWFVPGIFETANLDNSCHSWLGSTNVRDNLFEELFVTKDPKKPAPFAPAKGTSCQNASLPSDQVNECNQAQLLIRLSPALQKAVCHMRSDDPRRDFRNLLYIRTERALYEPALVETRDATSQEIQDWYQKLETDIVPDLLKAMPSEELSNGLRVLAFALRAYQINSSATSKWLNRLNLDIKSADLQQLRESSTLSWESRSELHPAVLPLRDSIADLLTLPRMQILGWKQTSVVGNREILEATTALLQVLSEISRTAESQQSFSISVRWLSHYTDTLSKVITELKTADLTTTLHFSDALGFLKDALELGADRDWAGLAIRISEKVDNYAKEEATFRGLARPLAFVRVLMSMYQAKSTEDAKAIFQAQLEEETSRERRYISLSVDAAALVAVRGGRQFTKDYDQATPPNPEPTTYLYGLYVPFGVQVAYKCIGGLAYPVDLGTYFTATGESEEDLRWRDALRFGLAIYWRPSSTLPIVLGGGTDYRPRFEDTTERRTFGFVALELPLFLIY